ncbi:hypothetical protein AB4Z18_08160 [Leifsonia sp. 2TAF2]|uniref:hypothetical protein n=1 Tax=Leifsonia sp. 2TAF2 TaxID=3233009 RepID=UPI003F95869B
MWVRRILIAIVAYALFALALGAVGIVAQHGGRSAAEDAPRALLSSQDVSDQPARLDLARVRGTFWLRYNAVNEPTAGNGYLGNRLATIPGGVLDAARRSGEDAVTWAPANGLRFAIVAQRLSGGDVLVSGQSLERTELRASQMIMYLTLALLAGLLLIATAVVVDWQLSRRKTLPQPGP